MTDMERRAAAAKFSADWKGRGGEKQETQRFWIELLTKVFGVDGSTAIAFEVPVKLDYSSFIDGYIADTRVLIEQKGRDIDLKKESKQSDGSMLTPYQQVRHCTGYLLHDQNQVRGGTDEDVSATDNGLSVFIIICAQWQRPTLTFTYFEQS